MTGYHTGRSLGKKNWVYICSGNIYGTPYQKKEAGIFSTGTVKDAEEFLTWANGEMQFFRGISDRFDLGFRMNSELMFGLMTKYQLVGTRSSDWAIAIGMEYGVLLPARTYAQFPLILSYHSNDHTSFYYSPRFIKEWNNQNSPQTQINYLGWNMGFQTGKTTILAMEVGFYRSVRFDADRYLPEKFQEHVLPIVGLGLIVPF